MKIQSIVLFTICAAGLALPSAAQVTITDHNRPAGKARHLSPSLQKKIQDRIATMRSLAADEPAGPIGPIIDREPAEWTIETKDCSLLKSQLKGTGFIKDTVFVMMNDDGTFHVDDRQEASGTAVDAAGNKYVWIYNSLGDVDTTNPDPTSGAPFTLVGPDTFQLIPATTAGSSYMMAQFFNLKVDKPGTEIIPQVANAPLGCDPL